MCTQPPYSYFDWAATSIDKPPQVIDAVVTAMNTYGNPSRGSHPYALAALRCMEEARTTIARFFDVAHPTNVIFTAGTTAALNTALNGLNGPIVTTAAEHNSILRPVYRHGNYVVVPVSDHGLLDLDHLAAALSPATAAVVIGHSSNVTGNTNDLLAIGDICKQLDIPLIVDAAQSAGQLAISMKNMNISALCFSGHKSLDGPQGTGCLCLGNGFRPPPLLVGGTGSHSFEPAQPQQLPLALEAGTQNIHGIAGLLAAIKLLEPTFHEHYQTANRLAAMFIAACQQIDGITLYGDVDAPNRTPVVSLTIAGEDSAEIAYLLEHDYQIAVRPGFHCAPLMHRALGTETSGTVRFSFSHKNTVQQVNTAISAVDALAKKFATQRSMP